MGFLCLLLFGFGWARPVPVNISNFKNRRRGMALTALAGPVSNFITAFIAYCLYLLVWMHSSSAFMQTLGMFLSIVGSMSVGLGVFNLIPVHPLDGSRVVDAFLPFSWSSRRAAWGCSFRKWKRWNFIWTALTGRSTCCCI